MGDAMRVPALAAAGWLLGAPAASAEDPSCPGHVSVPSAQATYYVSGSPNACSLPVAPGEYFAAAATPEFAGSTACGRCLDVTGPLGSVLVRVVDECPGCGAGDLDLSPEAFAQIADPVDGIAAISYQSIECPVSGPIRIYFSMASTPDYAQVQIRNHLDPVVSVEAHQGGLWVALPRSPDNYFLFDMPPDPVPNPIDLRITDLYGAVLVDSGVPFAANTELAGPGQFAPCPEPGSGAAAMLATAALGFGRRARRRERAPR